MIAQHLDQGLLAFLFKVGTFSPKVKFAFNTTEFLA
jgi:hypothetical protein